MTSAPGFEIENFGTILAVTAKWCNAPLHLWEKLPELQHGGVLWSFRRNQRHIHAHDFEILLPCSPVAPNFHAQLSNSTQCVCSPNKRAKTLFLRVSELILSCRFWGSANGLRKQHTYGHARRHPRLHERVHVVGPGLGQRPHLPPASRLRWQVRTATLWPGILKQASRLTACC